MGTLSPHRPFTIFALIVFLFLFAIFLLLQPSLYIRNYQQFFIVSQIKNFISPPQQSTDFSAQNGHNPIPHNPFPNATGVENEENRVSESENGTRNDGKESQSTEKTASDATAKDETNPVADQDSASNNELSIDNEKTVADGRENGTSNDGKESQSTEKAASDATAKDETNPVADHDSASNNELSIDNEKTEADGSETVGNNVVKEPQSIDVSAKDEKTVANSDNSVEVSQSIETKFSDGSAKDEKNPVSASDNGDAEEESSLVREMKRCDLYKGSWVKDQDYPLYEPGSCPYVDEAFDCQNNGRRDSNYLRWRWKPDDCNLPRFNATDFLNRLRGKRLMLVGDSMNRNQFESILCLLREGLSDKSRMYEAHGQKITKGRGYFVFKFVDYDCTVEFVRSHFLVKEGVRINAQGNTNPTLSIDVIDKTAKKWRRPDIIVFNTGHWWVHGKTARGVNYYKEGDYVYPKFDAVEAYRKALRTWAKWVDENMKPGKQMVFYRGYSSAHFRGGDWDSGGSCNGETEPVRKGAILESYPLKMKIVEEVIREMNFPVMLLNVTRLTNFRKDGHPSIFGKKLIEGKKVSSRKQDCSHWCLPGVPDVWNELIYASLVLQQTISNN